MTLSFRLRLFVVAALIVTTVLASVLLLSRSSVLAFEIDRLDDRLCMEAQRLTAPQIRSDRITRLEADIGGKLHLNAPNQLMLRFDAATGLSGFQSTYWQEHLHPETWRWSAPRPQGIQGRPEGPPPGAPGHIRPLDGPPGTCSMASFTDSQAQWRAARFDMPMGRGLVAADLAATKAELQGAVNGVLTLVVPLALVLTALGAWLLSGLMMRPVNRLREAMKAVTGKALDQRLAGHREDREFRELIDAYNTMLARLESNFNQASRFSADAAHELKTPLTILQGRIEQAIQRSDQRTIQSDLIGMLDEVGRLTTITRKLLLLAQADAGPLALHLTRIDLTELLEGLMADTHMLVGAQTVSTSIEPGLILQGDAVLLGQLFNNLISNAVRYSVPDGWITVRSRRRRSGIEVIFANATHTIAPTERQRFFDRFYRGEAAYGQHVDGNGLGLSLAREIATAHGGELTLLSETQQDVTLQLWLPHG